MRRRDLIAMLGGLAAAPLAAPFAPRAAARPRLPAGCADTGRAAIGRHRGVLRRNAAARLRRGPQPRGPAQRLRRPPRADRHDGGCDRQGGAGRDHLGAGPLHARVPGSYQDDPNPRHERGHGFGGSGRIARAPRRQHHRRQHSFCDAGRKATGPSDRSSPRCTTDSHTRRRRSDGADPRANHAGGSTRTRRGNAGVPHRW